jgi:hypothetical protein
MRYEECVFEKQTIGSLESGTLRYEAEVNCRDVLTGRSTLFEWNNRHWTDPRHSMGGQAEGGTGY